MKFSCHVLADNSPSPLHMEELACMIMMTVENTEITFFTYDKVMKMSCKGANDRKKKRDVYQLTSNEHFVVVVVADSYVACQNI